MATNTSTRKSLFIGLLIITGIALSTKTSAQNIRISTGIEVLKESGFRVLHGKRVGLITNPTGVDNNLKSTIDILHEAPGVTLVHSTDRTWRARRCACRDKIDSFTDPNTGVPVHSLYGATRKPTPEMLEGVDLLVYDIQDIAADPIPTSPRCIWPCSCGGKQH